jgi:2-methylisocitrate lyase-like PEP mutase family enzyme
MAATDQAARAARFRELNRAGRLLLPNAWDAASARVFAATGFHAIATTSGGIANARGLPDAERISRSDMLREISAIADAVDVPVSADIEAGYGDSPETVVSTVEAVLEVGAVGINLEDRAHRSTTAPLYSVEAQCARITAAREAARRHGIDMVINARTDVVLAGIGADDNERASMALARGQAYLRAGADLLFIPGLVDLSVVRTVAAGVQGGLSLMALPGAPPANDLFEAGAVRVSLGNIAMLAVFGALRDMAADVARTGTWHSLERTFLGFEYADTLFGRTPRRANK